MKNCFIKTAVLLLCAAVFISCSKKGTQPQNQKLNIAVSSYVPYTFAKSVLGNLANLTLLVPPGTEPHAFEPSSKNILEVNQAEKFFYVSDILEPWALKIAPKGISLAKELPQVSVNDPHVWMNFDNAQKMALNLAKDIIKKYPSLESEINKNYLNFFHNVQDIKQAYTEVLPTCKNRTIYHIGHLAFGYIAKDFNLSFNALFSADMDQEPSAKEIARLVKNIKDNKVKYIFSEEQLNPALAKTISKETGAKILMLNTIEGISKEDFIYDKTYKDLMAENLENLIIGLDCKK
ncbi:MAG: zinc ABC transporter substrate-binding protein [Elusimicrobiaceae bacterium]|nr:zinc ABC transporter substrate-binding protein [Elusimicrobiaceae bacterium]